LNVYFRIIDSSGIAILDPQVLKYQGTVVAGGGTISNLLISTSYPNLVYATIKTGPDPDQNTFRVAFASFAPITFNVTGTKASPATGRLPGVDDLIPVSGISAASRN
jgi:hypothetical protein